MQTINYQHEMYMTYIVIHLNILEKSRKKLVKIEKANTTICILRSTTIYL